jgi:ubiquinone/menaquinone biosynthesis C-methylase UbiE
MFRIRYLSILISLFIINACKGSLYTETNNEVGKIEDTLALENIDHHTTNIGRAIWQKPGLVIQKLGNIEDKVVADIGAGTGYFSFRLAPRAKKVIAIEIEKRLLEYIDSLKINLPQDKRNNLETRLATPSNPMINDNEADIILIINTIAYIEDLPIYLKTLKKGLKKQGRLMIIDYKMKKLPINAPPKSERLYLDKLEELLEEAGYKIFESDDTSLDFQYIVTANKI